MTETKQVSKDTYDNSLDSHTDIEEYKIDNHRKSWKGLMERAWYQFQDKVGVKRFSKELFSFISTFSIGFLLVSLVSSISVFTFINALFVYNFIRYYKDDNYSRFTFWYIYAMIYLSMMSVGLFIMPLLAIIGLILVILYMVLITEIILVDDNQ